MVRRGSTVRVRQRAYLKPRSRCKRGFFVADQDTLDHLLVKEGVERRRRGCIAEEIGFITRFAPARRSSFTFWGHVLGTQSVTVFPREATRIALKPRGQGAGE